jgi:hypothetical protein
LLQNLQNAARRFVATSLKSVEFVIAPRFGKRYKQATATSVNGRNPAKFSRTPLSFVISAGV